MAWQYMAAKHVGRGRRGCRRRPAICRRNSRPRRTFSWYGPRRWVWPEASRLNRARPVMPVSASRPALGRLRPSVVVSRPASCRLASQRPSGLLVGGEPAQGGLDGGLGLGAAAAAQRPRRDGRRTCGADRPPGPAGPRRRRRPCPARPQAAGHCDHRRGRRSLRLGGAAAVPRRPRRRRRRLRRLARRGARVRDRRTGSFGATGAASGSAHRPRRPMAVALSAGLGSPPAWRGGLGSLDAGDGRPASARRLGDVCRVVRAVGGHGCHPGVVRARCPAPPANPAATTCIAGAADRRDPGPQACTVVA